MFRITADLVQSAVERALAAFGLSGGEPPELPTPPVYDTPDTPADQKTFVVKPCPTVDFSEEHWGGTDFTTPTMD